MPAFPILAQRTRRGYHGFLGDDPAVTAPADQTSSTSTQDPTAGTPNGGTGATKPNESVTTPPATEEKKVETKTSWFDEEMISGIPNMYLAVGGALALGALLLVGGKKRLSPAVIVKTNPRRRRRCR
jgi:hypothetical protein